MIRAHGWNSKKHRTRSLLIWFGVLCLVWVIFVPYPGLAQDTDRTQEFIRQKIEHLRQFDALQIGDVQIAATRLVAELYGRRNFRPAWSDEGNVKDLLLAIEEIEKDGLRPDDYHHTTLLKLHQDNGLPAAKTDLDLLLTDALIRLVYHIIALSLMALNIRGAHPN